MCAIDYGTLLIMGHSLLGVNAVSIVNFVLGNLNDISCADYNEDGNIDVLDVVSVVSLILGN